MVEFCERVGEAGEECGVGIFQAEAESGIAGFHRMSAGPSEALQPTKWNALARILGIRTEDITCPYCKQKLAGSDGMSCEICGTRHQPRMLAGKR